MSLPRRYVELFKAQDELVHDDIGRGPLIGIILASAVVASYASMSAYILSGVLTSSSLGASGILAGMMGVLCVIHEG